MSVRELLTDTQFDAVGELKKRLILPPILALLRHGYMYILDTDACQSHIGRALLQERREDDSLQAGRESTSPADDGDDTSLKDEVPCFPVKATADAGPDKQTAVGW